ncbi:hypothetical protein BB558_004093 [Smittium angustum]|uniref:RING-type domain-containing protein n=1 Tax=Smittium angustum TaxID=133377 RepID=A0A2U1J495_SMIAN|nr:hypothetical protein BB558_004093 [Smittium angustum]
MYYYHIYIETYRLDFSNPKENKPTTHPWYHKSLFENEWKLLSLKEYNRNKLSTSFQEKELLSNTKDNFGTSSKSQTYKNKNTEYKELYSGFEKTVLNLSNILPKNTIIDKDKSNLISLVKSFCGKYKDCRFSELSIESYNTQDLKALPEVEELETRFYKIAMSKKDNFEQPGLNKSSEDQDIHDESYEIGVSWEPRQKKTEYVSFDEESIVKNQSSHFHSTNTIGSSANSHIQKSSSYSEHLSSFTNSLTTTSFNTQEAFDYEHNQHQISGKDHEGNFKSKKKPIAVPLGIFEVSPSEKQEFPAGILHLYRGDLVAKPSSQPFSKGIDTDKIVGGIGTTKSKNKEERKISEKRNDGVIVPVEEGKTLAVLAVPAYMTPSDFVSFVGSFKHKISQFRVIRNSLPSNYMVILRFRERSDTKEFYEYYNQKTFSPLEPEICHVVYIKSITIASGALPVYQFPLFHDDLNLKYKQETEPVDSLSKNTTNKEINTSETSNVDSVNETQPAHNNDVAFSNDLFSTSLDINKFYESDTNPDLKFPNFSENTNLPVVAELPTCPVCLERMDTSISGLLTILCQHTFHCSCLAKWSDNSCPVCRHAQAGMFVDNDLFDETVPSFDTFGSNGNFTSKLTMKTNSNSFPDDNDNNGITSTSYNNENNRQIDQNLNSSLNSNINNIDDSGYNPLELTNQHTKCKECGYNKQLWVCLVCGNVGCGRYKFGHARSHFVESGHIYSMELDSQRVWDYVGDSYVHRLLLNRTDGKLVELSAPASESYSRENNNNRSRQNDFSEQNQLYDSQGNRINGTLAFDVDVENNNQHISNSGFNPHQHHSLNDCENDDRGGFGNRNSMDIDQNENGDSSTNRNGHTNSYSYSSFNQTFNGSEGISNSEFNNDTTQSKHNMKSNSREEQYGTYGRFNNSYPANITQIQGSSNLELVREKLAAVATEYEHTLKSQLEANTRDYETKILRLQNLCKEYLKKQYSASKQVGTLQQQLDLEKQMSSNLLTKVESLQKEKDALSNKVNDLQEQVRDLYMHFETLQRVETDKSFGEMVNTGTIKVGPAKKNSGANKSKSVQKNKPQKDSEVSNNDASTSSIKPFIESNLDSVANTTIPPKL